MDPNFFQLIPPEQKDQVFLYSKEKPHMAFPAVRVIP